LGKILAMDSTSLTRTLRIMRREGWILERPGKDRRERLLRMSEGGDKELKLVLPVWEQVQTGLRRQLGEQIWNQLFQLTNEVTRVVTN
jgi:DNA-binding MarR family transcriptional regulator